VASSAVPSSVAGDAVRVPQRLEHVEGLVRRVGAVGLGEEAQGIGHGHADALRADVDPYDAGL